MVGAFQFLLGVLRLGVVVNFLSHPVVNGFTNAAAIIIATSQLDKLFGVGVDRQARLEALRDANVDVVVVDTAHGHSRNVIERVKRIKAEYPSMQVIGGNIATGEAGLALADVGADAVKVGIGPGSICTTRIVTGIGVPQVTAIADVSNPQAPFLTWESGSISDSENIQVFGDLVASPAGCGSLEILDVSDPGAPAMLGSPRAPSCNSLDVAMSAGFVLIAAGNDGLLAYPGHCATVSSTPVSELPRSFGSITVAPNPFNPMTQIGVSIPAPTVMTLRVYGLDGKMVKEIYDGEVEAGHHQFTWDGRDVFGRPVGSGTYITLLDSPLGRQSRSMLLIK